MRGRGLLLLALLLSPLPAAGLASPWVVNGPSRVRLVTAYRTAPAEPNAELRLGLHFLLDPEWHVYWKNSGDAGYPPTLDLKGAPAPVQAELLWPAPRRFELRGGLVAFGYEREVIYPVRARWVSGGGGGAGGKERLTADLDYLVCQVDCIPFHSQLALDQPTGAPDRDPETAPAVERAFQALPATLAGLPPGFDLGAETTFEPGGSGAGGGRPALSVRLRGATAGAQGADLFLEPQDLFETGKPEVTPEPQALRFRVPLTPKQVGKPLPATFPFAWTATGIHPVHPLGGGAGEVAVADRETVPLRPAAASVPRAAEPAAGSTAVRAGGLAAGAVLSTLLALGLWGFLGSREAPGERGAPRPPTRDLLGFLAAGATLFLLYRLSRAVRTEGLAAIELSLLGMALCGWLRQIAPRRSKLSWVLLAALGLCAGLGVWLAAQSRLG